ncbi:MAG: hypothetical protein JW830_07850 [Bacteroidales bacterium]|nr:hypothetical protein [Bacteroidales bacterium]
MIEIRSSSFNTKRFALTGALVFQLFFTSYPQDLKEKHSSIILYMNVPSMAKIPEKQAEEISIAQRAWGADLGLELRLFRYAGLAIGVGMGSVKDHNSFSQNTTMGELESSFNLYNIDSKAGIWFPPIFPLKDRDLQINFRTNVGYEHIIGKREIDECKDCHEEKYKIASTIYLEPELDLFFYQNLIGVGTACRWYLSPNEIKYKIILLKLMLRLDF